MTFGICSVVGVVQLHGSRFQVLLRNVSGMHACRVVEVSLHGFSGIVLMTGKDSVLVTDCNVH